MLQPSQRIYTEKPTLERFRMFTDSETHEYVLISEKTGEKLKSFVACAFTAKNYKFQDGSTLVLNVNEFFRLDKNNMPTHEKFFMSKRFKKFKF